LNEGLCYNAMDAGKKLGLNANQLEKKWGACKKNCVKFGGGFYCSNLGSDEAPMYVFNGFFMSMREKFVAKGKSIYYYSVTWDSHSLSWEDFRGKLLGPTNPADAPKDSLRGQIFANWKKLGLPSEPDTGDNGVHASASPFEALAERMNWLGACLDTDIFGKAMLDSGISAETIKEWSEDPQVKGGSVFDGLEDTQAVDCLQKCVQLNTTDEKAQSTKRLVLPSSLKPVLYEITLTPNYEKFIFDGVCKIQCKVLESVSTVMVNQEALAFKSLKVSQGDWESSFSEEKIKVDEKMKRVSVDLEKGLKEGEVTLEFLYSGVLNDLLKGFYRSKHGEKWILTTQFEATSARMAFPCFDEPSLKAEFAVTIVCPKELQALSCMPEVKLSEEEKMKNVPKGFVRHKFQRTPVMSTYLLAWCIGEFECISSRMEKDRENPIDVSVYTTIGKVEEGRYALEVAVKSLEFYEQYFGIPYPLPKLDMIGIPDFDAGAMENWGLVTYRTSMFLCGPESSTSTKEVVCTTVTHELAHMWFGNLVSPEWWSQLWLKEGFACFCQYLCGAAVEPEMNMWKRFVEDDFVYALNVDGLETSHPIEVPVNDPHEIDEIFDGISYCKGASVIRMIISFLGEKHVRICLEKYLKNFAYSNAVTDDLWKFLQSDEYDVKEIMDNWTKQQGYPVVSVKRTSNTSFELEQHRFLTSGNVTPELDKTIWSIPMIIYVSNRAEPLKYLFQSRKAILEIPGLQDSDWIKLNHEYKGFYVVNYSSGMTKQLSQNISKLSTMDRFSLIKDYSKLIRSGHTNAAVMLDLIRGFVNNTDYSVWSCIESALSAIWHILDKDNKAVIRQYNKYVQDLFVPTYERLTFDGKESDNSDTRYLRSLVISTLGHAQYKPVIDKAQNLFRTFLRKNGKLDPDLRTAIYGIGSENGTEEDWQLLHAYYKETTVEDDIIRSLRYLGNFKQPELVKKLLAMLLDKEKVRRQNFGYPLMTAARNPHGTVLVWEFMQANWNDLYEECKGGTFMDWCSRAPQFLLGMDNYEQVKTFYETHKQGSASQGIRQVLEKIKNNTAWRERDLEKIEAYFTKDVKESIAVTILKSVILFVCAFTVTRKLVRNRR